jgi:hypothetical protein
MFIFIKRVLKILWSYSLFRFLFIGGINTLFGIGVYPFNMAGFELYGRCFSRNHAYPVRTQTFIGEHRDVSIRLHISLGTLARRPAY